MDTAERKRAESCRSGVTGADGMGWRRRCLPSGRRTGRLGPGTALCVTIAALAVTGCAGSRSGHDSRAVLEWSTHAAEAIELATKGLDPLTGTRTLAMVHVAMHDAVNSAERRFQGYAFRRDEPGAHPEAAAAAAAHQVLVKLFPDQAATLRARLDASLAGVPDGAAERRGVALGEEAGDAVVQLRAADGAGKVVEYRPGAGPGKYQFVAPFDGFIAHPEWHFVTPWTLGSASQFRSVPPPALASEAYRTDYAEVKATGRLETGDRTAEQTAYARFWYENSDTGWNRITRDAVARRNLSLHDGARLFALVNMAMADGFIAGWDSKFHYDFWRPLTAIRGGETDGNDGTAGDPGWEPLLPTPPVQDYPSTHSVLGAAAAAVLAGVLGDETTFSFTSSTAEDPAVPRTYQRFSVAAAENGDSRVRAGIHFRAAVNAGLQMGQTIGEHVLASHSLEQ